MRAIITAHASVTYPRTSRTISPAKADQRRKVGDASVRFPPNADTSAAALAYGVNRCTSQLAFRENPGFGGHSLPQGASLSSVIEGRIRRFPGKIPGRKVYCFSPIADISDRPFQTFLIYCSCQSCRCRGKSPVGRGYAHMTRSTESRAYR